MYLIVRSAKMKRDTKRVRKRGYDMSKLEDVLIMLSTGETLPAKYKDHALKGDMLGFRECHIEDDWLLIYRIFKDKLVLLATGTGTHTDLFC